MYSTFSGSVKYPSLGTIPEIPQSGGIFPKYVPLQNFNRYFLNLSSRHTSMGMPSSQGFNLLDGNVG